MKKWLRIGLIIIFLGLNTKIVLAQSISIVCPKSVRPGNKFSCIINASHNEEYGAVEGLLSYSDGLTYNSFSRSFSNGEIYNNKLSVYDVDLKKGTAKVGTITFTLNKNVKDNQIIKLSNVMMYDADSLGLVVGEVKTTVKVDTSVKKSSSASSGKGGNASSGTGTAINSSKIKALVIANGEINFKKDVLEYDITVGNDVTKLDLDITLESGSSKYTVKGNKDFKEGENFVEIVVSPKSGKETIYKIKVTRLAKSRDSLLSDLVIKDYRIKFNENKFKYVIFVDKKIDSLDISTVTKDKNSYVVIGGNKDIKTGSRISIVVQAEDKSTSMYELYIIEKSLLMYLGIGSGIILLLGIFLILLVKKRKKKMPIFMDLQ